MWPEKKSERKSYKKKNQNELTESTDGVEANLFFPLEQQLQSQFRIEKKV